MSANRVNHAAMIARAAHWDQFDRGGAPRFNHVEYVANQMFEELYQVVGYLHDTIEDSPLTTLSALKQIFGWEVADAVDAISRRNDETYFDYIRRCKENPIARVVKIADIKHNMDRTRWPEMPDSYYEREVKALAILRDENCKTEDVK